MQYICDTLVGSKQFIWLLIMRNIAPESLQFYVDNLNYNLWNPEDGSIKAVIDGAAFINIQYSYCQLICDLYEQTSPEVTYYFVTSVLGKEDAAVKAFINKLYILFKKDGLDISANNDIRAQLFDFCTAIREQNFPLIHQANRLSSSEKAATATALNLIFADMLKVFAPNPDVAQQFAPFSNVIRASVRSRSTEWDREWQDRTANMYEVLRKLASDHVANWEEFSTLAHYIKTYSLFLDFNRINDGLGNLQFVAKQIPHRDIKASVLATLVELESHQEQMQRRRHAAAAVIAAPIAPLVAAPVVPPLVVDPHASPFLFAGAAIAVAVFAGTALYVLPAQDRTAILSLSADFCINIISRIANTVSNIVTAATQTWHNI